MKVRDEQSADKTVPHEVTFCVSPLAYFNYMPISITQKTRIQLLANHFWSILSNIMASFLKHWGSIFLLVAVSLFIAGAEISNYRIYMWSVSCVLLVVAIYQFIAGYRLAKWVDYRKELEKEAVGKPRPSDPIATIAHKLLKNKR